MGWLLLGGVVGVLGGKFLYSFPAPRAFAFSMGDKIAGLVADAPIEAPISELEFGVGQGVFEELE